MVVFFTQGLASQPWFSRLAQRYDLMANTEYYPQTDI